MNSEERETLEAAMRGSEQSSGRLYSFDAINDDLENRAINLVAHCTPNQTKRGKIEDETSKITAFAKEHIGRELRADEVVIRAIEAPKQTTTMGRV